MTPPLAGLLVLDFTTLLPGPLAALMLAEAGADVVKIERPPVGDEMRTYVPRWGADSTNFALLNRGKSSVALDLKDPAQKQRLMPLLAKADIVIEQFRPGVMDRLGLGYEAIRAINPRVIYCAITGYGQTGPKRDVAGHDLNYIGDTGLLSVSSGDPAKPVIPPALVADIAAGAYPAFMNILLAVIARQSTGRGAYLDVAMTDNIFPFLYWAIGKALGTGEWAGNGTDLVTGATPRYHLFPAADDRLVAVAAIEQRFWENFCRLIDLDPALRDDTKDPAATTAGIAAILRGKPGAHWRAVFEGQDCCCSVVASVREAMEDPHVAARGLFRGTVSGSGTTLPALPVPVLPIFRDAGQDKHAPALGADTDRLTPRRS
ncbi:MAG: CaiB/BaiF CoA-transferase family protein [Rhodopila sp.]|nr:CaiB/BaiF CoA-transferase family protein [Rhodopila sp.]